MAAFAKFMEAIAELKGHIDKDYCEYGCYAKVIDS